MVELTRSCPQLLRHYAVHYDPRELGLASIVTELMVCVCVCVCVCLCVCKLHLACLTAPSRLLSDRATLTFLVPLLSLSLSLSLSLALSLSLSLSLSPCRTVTYVTISAAVQERRR